MNVIHDYPPNYEKIADAFDIRGRDTIIFCYGDTIYAPKPQPLPDHIIAHENVHSRQQFDFGGVEKWWDAYLEDPKFRLSQELEAYLVQYEFVKQRYSRSDRKKIFRAIVKDLSGPMYGNLITKEKAEELIK